MRLGAQGQVIDIQLVAPHDFGTGNNISGDGLTVVGAQRTTADANSYAFSWDKRTLTSTILSPLGADPSCIAWCANKDGSFVGGTSKTTVGPVATAVYWNGGGAVDTGVNTDNTAFVTAISDDGSYMAILSFSTVPTTTGGHVYHSAVATALANPANPTAANGCCKPTCISGNGLVIGGYYDRTVAGVRTFPPVLWDATDGSVISVLSTPAGWTPTDSASFYALNYDGSLGFLGIRDKFTQYGSSLNALTFVTAAGNSAFRVGVWTGGSNFTEYTRGVIVNGVQMARIPRVGGRTRLCPQPNTITPNGANPGVCSLNGLLYATTRDNGLGGQPIHISMLA